MDLQAYQQAAINVGYTEYPMFISSENVKLKSFIDFESTDKVVKIHLGKVLINRCFPISGGIAESADVHWFVEQFFATFFKQDNTRPWLSPTIKEAALMINSDDAFVKGVLGTTFMFGIIEFYAKYLIGWKNFDADFFDEKYHEKYRTMTIEQAFGKLRKLPLPVAKTLCEIDTFNIERAKEFDITEERFMNITIAKRLRVARNSMLHGENHAFYDKGLYLVMLYIIFHLHKN